MVRISILKRFVAIFAALYFLIYSTAWIHGASSGFIEYTFTFHLEPRPLGDRRTKVTSLQLSRKARALPLNHHYFMRNISILEPITKNKRYKYSGLPATTEVYNSSYKNPCWNHQDKVFCLPYFFLAGFPKCGTTEFFSKLSVHPEIIAPVGKEPHWWTRSRFQEGSQRVDYRQYFEPVSKMIQCHPTKITMDASVSTVWDNSKLFPAFGDTSTSDPALLTVHYIHWQLPHAKCIILVREPVQRLYSGYLWFDRVYTGQRSPQDFHARVLDALRRFNNCMSNSQLSGLHCVYAKLPHTDLLIRLRIGLYSVHISTWITAYTRESLLVVRLEDFSRNPIRVLQDVYDFLGVEHMEDIQGLMNQTLSSPRVAHDNSQAYKSIGPMLPETRRLLVEFYRPYNEQLAKLLGNKRFLYNDN